MAQADRPDLDGDDGLPAAGQSIVPLTALALRLHDEAGEARAGQSVGTVRTLMVEDDQLQMLALQGLFAAANKNHVGAMTFDVSTASCASEALAFVHAAQEHIDLILLDMMLPDRPGFDILPELRDVLGLDTAIVMMSACTETSHMRVCVQRGTCDVESPRRVPWFLSRP